ncbi:hypothetical protein KFE25_009635 [Diacronema lutheri]|uniref:Uncharacterized protein n=1 Tax=Diacronema lutheri TaxID=2081491 RepID=A0A8J5Y629_DIALT|nr:hypothetical protein KFE25_009635 [Diacronema lutheri]
MATPGGGDAVVQSWTAHSVGLERLQDSLDSADRLVHQSVRRKNEQLSRLQDELRGLRSRAVEREARARATLERAFVDATGVEGVREGARRAERDELASALAERDEAIRQLRAQLRDQEQRATDARTEARERTRALDDRERQLELLREKNREAEAERSAEAAAAAAVAAARADESRERALEAELAQLRRAHASRLEAEHDEAARRETQLRRELAAANARADAERARADELADALAADKASRGESVQSVADRAELEKAHAALERARADLAARDASLADARAALARAEQAAAQNVASAAHAQLSERDATIAELRDELERARAGVGGAHTPAVARAPPPAPSAAAAKVAKKAAGAAGAEAAEAAEALAEAHRARAAEKAGRSATAAATAAQGARGAARAAASALANVAAEEDAEDDEDAAERGAAADGADEGSADEGDGEEDDEGEEGGGHVSGRSSRSASTARAAADGIRIVGSATLGGVVTVEGTIGGVPLALAAGAQRALEFDVEWVRVTPRGQSTRVAPSARADGLSVRVRAEDVGCVLRATVAASTPTGDEVTLSADSQTVEASKATLDLLARQLRNDGQIVFKVTDTMSQAARSLLLNTAKVKVRDGGGKKTLNKEAYSPTLAISLDDEHDDRFVLTLSARKQEWLRAQSAEERDVIALALRVFRAPAELEAIGGGPVGAIGTAEPASPASSTAGSVSGRSRASSSRLGGFFGRRG